MLKKILPIKIVSIILTILLLTISVIVGVAAEDMYGTYEDGIMLSNGADIFKQSPTEKPENLDFTQGLKYWASFRSSKYASEFAEVMEDGTGNKFINFHGTASANSLIVSWPFSLPNAVSGEQLTLVVKYKGSAANVTLGQGEGINEHNLAKRDLPATSLDGDWAYSVITIAANTVDLEKTFHVYFQSSATDVSTYIDKVTIVRKDAQGNCYTLDGELYDEHIDYGSFEQGLSTTNGAIFGSSYVPAKTCNNLDFSQGFKYWGRRLGGYPTNGNGEGSITLKNDTADGNLPTIGDADNYIRMMKGTTQYCSIISSYPFYLANVSTGDNLAVIIKWRGNSEFALEWATNGYNSTNKAHTVLSSNINGWNYSKVTLVSSATEGAKYNLGIQFRSASDTEYVDIDELLFIKESNNKYYTLDGAEYVVPGINGSFENGIASNYYATSSVYYRNTIDYFNNFDFSKGLEFWGTVNPQVGKDQYPSEYIKLINNQGNYSFAFKDTCPQNFGMMSVPFALENIDRTRDFMVIFETKNVTSTNYKSFNFKLRNKGTGVTTNLNGLNDTNFKCINGEGWTPYRTSAMGTAGKIGNSDDKLDFMFQSNTTDSSSIANCEFDNFMIVYWDRNKATVKKEIMETYDGKPIGYEMGDANMDGAADIADLVAVKKAIEGINGCDTTQLYHAATNFSKDFNDDGSIIWDGTETAAINTKDFAGMRSNLLK